MRMKVRVPATTANVGAGFDCIGIALDWYDELALELPHEGLQLEVTGEAAAQVPLDASHLVVASIQRGLEEWGDGQLPGMKLTCHNTIPHSRGLGSSAAAIAAGLAFAWGIARGPELDRAEIGRLACVLEGHADNAAAAVHGGATLGWLTGQDVLLSPLRVHESLQARVWIPEFEVPTRGARAVLPERISRLDGVAQAATAAHLVLAISERPDLLLHATEDRLHQHHRASLMPASFDLMQALRRAGVPATISGAGPTIFAIGTTEQLRAADEVSSAGFAHADLGIGGGVELLIEE